MNKKQWFCLFLLIAAIAVGWMSGFVQRGKVQKTESQFNMDALESWCGDGETVTVLSGYPVDAHTLLDDYGNVWHFDKELEENTLHIMWTKDNGEIVKLWKEVDFYE